MKTINERRLPEEGIPDPDFEDALNWLVINSDAERKRLPAIIQVSDTEVRYPLEILENPKSCVYHSDAYSYVLTSGVKVQPRVLNTKS